MQIGHKYDVLTKPCASGSVYMIVATDTSNFSSFSSGLRSESLVFSNTMRASKSAAALILGGSKPELQLGVEKKWGGRLKVR